MWMGVGSHGSGGGGLGAVIHGGNWDCGIGGCGGSGD